MPAIFAALRIKSLIKIFSVEPAAQTIYDIIFGRIVDDLNETNLKMLDELQSLLTKFDRVDAEQQKTILDIAVFAVVNLSKHKKNKEHYDRLRVTLFDIIRSCVVTDDADASKLCIERTLPAFATIVKTMVARSETDDSVATIFKLFMKNTVDCTNSFTIKLLNVAVSNKATLQYSADELKELIELYWADFKRMCGEGDVRTSEGILKTIFDSKSIDEWTALLCELETNIKASVFTEKADQQYRILASMARCQMNKVKGQVSDQAIQSTTSNTSNQPFHFFCHRFSAHFSKISHISYDSPHAQGPAARRTIWMQFFICSNAIPFWRIMFR